MNRRYHPRTVPLSVLLLYVYSRQIGKEEYELAKNHGL